MQAQQSTSEIGTGPNPLGFLLRKRYSAVFLAHPLNQCDR